MGLIALQLDTFELYNPSLKLFKRAFALFMRDFVHFIPTGSYTTFHFLAEFYLVFLALAEFHIAGPLQEYHRSGLSILGV